jgi:carbonic anhydrase/acetyltransferase-like protein (isoleucine patch superfamily)
MAIYEFDGKAPRIGKNVYIAPNATVIGDVEIGDDSSIWFSAVVRGDMYPIRIGKNVNVQDGAVVHVTAGMAETHIGDNVVIGHLALVHGCTIGSRCLIGMGATVLDNAQIGDECLIAAGALITPRTKIANRSFVVGRPGKVMREVSENDLFGIDAGAASYREFAAIYQSSRVRQIG